MEFLLSQMMILCQFWCKNFQYLSRGEVNPGSLGKPRQRASQEDERWGVKMMRKEQNTTTTSEKVET